MPKVDKKTTTVLGKPIPTSIPRVENACVVVIDGEIGAGKSTLISLVHNRLAKVLGNDAVVTVPEPVDLWKEVGILQEFYEDNTEKEAGLIAYDFQTFTFVTRVRETLEQVEKNSTAKVYLLERSILTDRFVFMELQKSLVGERRCVMYDMWWEMWRVVMPFEPSCFVYLKPSIDDCMERVCNRAREGEVDQKTDDSVPDLEEDVDTPKKRKGAEKGGGGVSAAYQIELRRAHEAYLQGMHSEDFPTMPQRPFELDEVLVLEGKIADDNFSIPGNAQDSIVDRIVQHVLACPEMEQPTNTSSL